MLIIIATLATAEASAGAVAKADQNQKVTTLQKCPEIFDQKQSSPLQVGWVGTLARNMSRWFLNSGKSLFIPQGLWTLSQQREGGRCQLDPNIFSSPQP